MLRCRNYHREYIITNFGVRNKIKCTNQLNCLIVQFFFFQNIMIYNFITNWNNANLKYFFYLP